MKRDIILSGVGGQGILSIAAVIGRAALEDGLHIKQAEVHGMSQRGGSVSSQVRYGDDVQSPVIEMGTADIIVAFEKMEALRYIDFLKEDGKIIVNDAEIWPLPVVIGKATYPEKILETLQEKANVRVMNASALAEEMGNLKVMNVILLGAIIKSMGLQDINWDEIIRNNVKPKFVDLNIKAMAVGMDAVN